MIYILLALLLLGITFFFFLSSALIFSAGEINKLKIGFISFNWPALLWKFKKKTGNGKENSRGKKKKKGNSLKKLMKKAPIYFEMAEVVVKNSRAEFYISTGDPFSDGLASGVKYSFGLHNFHPSFDIRPKYLFLYGTRLFTFVRIGVLWIMETIRKGVRNVFLH